MRHSMSCPMVIRLGMACVFTMMSGTTPSHVQGMSSWRYVIPMVPFCPWRELNLSPICGTRMFRTRTLQSLKPWELVVSKTRSTIPDSFGRIRRLESRFVMRIACVRPTCAKGVVRPMSTSDPDTRTPGATRPSGSSLSYCEGSPRPWHSMRFGTSKTSERRLPMSLEVESFSSALRVRKKVERMKPRSMALWFMMRLSSWLYPV
mmetsp:Transcript_752/g.3069  ORF Transcript_752/g.3069 Transcript_752/m.3069 type:complete len:205 (+) Transcript_752:782-1396(+)